MNSLKTIFLLVALTVLLVLVGDLVGGPRGMLTFFFIALALNFGAYWFSDKIVLGLYGAKPADENSRLARIVRQVSQQARIPMPKVYVIETDHANAFATGRSPAHAAVCATTGIMGLLNDEELAGVIAHEVAHIRNRDTLIATIAAVIAGAITMISRMAFFLGGSRDNENRNPYAGLLLLITAPIAAFLIQMAISRSREYAADETGASIVRNPTGLASALHKIHLASQRIALNANPATAHMFIINPISGRNLAHLFSTHPPVEDRIARLMAMTRRIVP